MAAVKPHPPAPRAFIAAAARRTTPPMIGLITAADAYAALAAAPDAVLCDVRTRREWQALGVPSLHALGKRTVLLPWQETPGAAPDPAFAAHLRAAGVAPTVPVYFLCRSGVRSQAAAEAAAAAGFTTVFNVVDGFEGRPGLPGWAGHGLPVTAYPVEPYPGSDR